MSESSFTSLPSTESTSIRPGWYLALRSWVSPFSGHCLLNCKMKEDWTRWVFFFFLFVIILCSQTFSLPSEIVGGGPCTRQVRWPHRGGGRSDCFSALARDPPPRGLGFLGSPQLQKCELVLWPRQTADSGRVWAECAPK